jgi:endonuclease/exonuclease/phosphatase family metal-dependent hydrolase
MVPSLPVVAELTWEAAGVRVVSFNIHHGTVGRRGPVDPEQLGEVCAGFEADVLCLQEVDHGTWRSGGRDLAGAVAVATGLTSVFGRSRRYPGGAYGNAVLVRGQVVAHHVTRLPRLPRHRFWQERRTLLEVEAVLDDGPVWVGCTHLAVPTAVNGPQLEPALHRFRDRPTPKVLAGDFNRPFEAVAPQAEQLGLSAPAHGPTFPAGRPRRSIDHVLHSPDLRVVHVEVRSTPMSDHAALLVDLERAAAG